MKVKCMVGIGLLLALAACEKDNDTTQTPDEPEANYYPLSTGSYWVYNTYYIDSLGNEELISESDTTMIIGDSILENGFTYKKFLGKRYGFSNNSKEIFLKRDSSGYIITPSGNIAFSQNDFENILYQTEVPEDNPIYSWFYKMEKYEGTCNLGFESFEIVLSNKCTVQYLAEPDQPEAYFDNLYAPNVGQVTKQTVFIHSFLSSKNYYEDRLISYHIAE